MIIDDLRECYVRFIDLCKNDVNNDNQELIFQKLCYIIFRLRELCVEINEFSNDIFKGNINSLTTEQLTFYENMKHTQNVVQNILPVLISNELNKTNIN